MRTQDEAVLYRSKVRTLRPSANPVVVSLASVLDARPTTSRTRLWGVATTAPSLNSRALTVGLDMFGKYAHQAAYLVAHGSNWTPFYVAGWSGDDTELLLHEQSISLQDDLAPRSRAFTLRMLCTADVLGGTCTANAVPGRNLCATHLYGRLATDGAVWQ